MSEYSFPVESIELPSGGKFYPEGHPLRSGKIDVKYMTAREEDILTSTNLIKKGTVLDKLMESLIVTKGVKPDDMLTGDLNAVMIAARILAYGKDYPVELLCTSCGEKFQHVIDLTALETIAAGDLSENGEHKVTLPTGVVVTFNTCVFINIINHYFGEFFFSKNWGKLLKFFYFKYVQTNQFFTSSFIGRRTF